MNYFKFNLGDFLRSTPGYSFQERGVYVALLIEYFAHERPLPKDVGEVCGLIGARRAAEKAAVRRVLQISFELTDDGWRAPEYDLVIANYKANAQKNRKNANKTGQTQKPVASQSPANGVVTSNQEPETIKYAAAVAAPGPFGECLTILRQAHPEIPVARWRPLIGKLRQLAGDDAKVVAAVRRCTALGITDPVSWLMAALKPPPTEETFTSYRKLYQQ